MAILNYNQIYSLAIGQGLSSAQADIATAIALAESGGNTSAHNPGNPARGDIENSWGLWQINLLAHPNYNSSQMQNPTLNAQAMRAISSGGTNWNPWGTYTSGAYRAYLGRGAVIAASHAATSYRSANSDNYPIPQCTWGASLLYHQATGIYPPNDWGNAASWAGGGKSSGWNVSGTPPQGMPSIIVLAPGVQGADPYYGHVAFVKSWNGSKLTVLSANWHDANAPIVQTISGAPIRQINYLHPGNGVSFVWAGGAGAQSTGLGGGGPTQLVFQVANKFKLAPNADVSQFLTAVDQYLTLQNPFDVQLSNIQDNINLPLGAGSVSFTDPVAWLTEVGVNWIENMVVLFIRFIFIILGLYLILRVLRNFVDFQGATEKVSKVATNVSPLGKNLFGGGAAATEGVEGAAALAAV